VPQAIKTQQQTESTGARRICSAYNVAASYSDTAAHACHWS
jgi:hypothetical protein